MKLSRKDFKQNLVEALESKDCYVSDDILEKFLDLNYDEDSSLTEWTFSDFLDFASEFCACSYDLWETARSYDLHYPGEDDDNISRLLDELQEEFDTKRLGADIYEGDERPYIECCKSIEPVKLILKKKGVEIYDEYESEGSDYNSYIIELNFNEIRYEVHSDIDENNVYAEFDNEKDAIKYAKECDAQCWVDKVTYAMNGDWLDSDTVWAYTEDSEEDEEEDDE